MNNRHRTTNTNPALRLLLSLLLVMGPSLAPIGAAAAAADPVVAISNQMPCHDMPVVNGPVPNAGDEPGCPHCLGDASLTQCQCCAFAAPAGIPSMGVSAHFSENHEGYCGTLIGLLPPAPNQTPYRPPIPSV